MPFSSIHNGVRGLSDLPPAAALEIFFFIGLMELGFSTVQDDIEAWSKKEMNRLGWSADKQRTKAAIELNNGRAAMMGILGLIVHEKLNNDPYVLNSLLGFPVSFNQ